MGEVKTVVFEPAERWRQKEDLDAIEATSQKYWDSTDDEKRQAMLLIVRETLTQLIQDPASWVPTSIMPVNDYRLDLFISIHLAEIDEEVVKRKLEAEKALHEATEGTLQIAADLHAKDE